MVAQVARRDQLLQMLVEHNQAQRGQSRLQVQVEMVATVAQVRSRHVSIQMAPLVQMAPF
jgi:hypothetical protein